MKKKIDKHKIIAKLGVYQLNKTKQNPKSDDRKPKAQEKNDFISRFFEQNCT